MWWKCNSINYIWGTNSSLFENSYIWHYVWSLSWRFDMSRYICIVYCRKGNFVLFKNLQSEFFQLLRYKRNHAFFQYHFLSQKSDIWGTPCLPMAVEIKYTWLILEEYIIVDPQPNFWRNWITFGSCIAILVVKKWHLSPKKAIFRYYDVIVRENMNNENF